VYQSADGISNGIKSALKKVRGKKTTEKSIIFFIVTSVIELNCTVAKILSVQEEEEDGVLN